MRARVARIITHPFYNSDTADFDVAVLELGGPLPFSRHVQPVCLPAAVHVFPPRKKCLISGWGYLKEDFRKHHTARSLSRQPAKPSQASNTPSGLISRGFCICEFTYSLKFICLPKWILVGGICDCSLLCNLSRSQLRWSWAIPCLLVQLRLETSVLFVVYLLPLFFFCIFVLFVAGFTKSKQAPSVELKCWLAS